MVSYGTGVTLGPRMLGGFLCKLCDFYDQKYLAVYFPSKTLFGSVFPIKFEFIFSTLCDFFTKSI